jgi:surfeit locus 1 family protein
VIRLQQSLVVLLGLVAAAAMAVLGVWQLDVYRSTGAETAEARVAAPVLDLEQVAPPGVAVRDGFGRSVRFVGRYEPSLQVLVPLEADTSRYRVLSGLKQADGSIVPVVRGVVSSRTAPPAPEGTVTQTGVLLPSEDNVQAGDDASDEPTAIRLPALAQRWSGQLIGGFVTLSAADARAQGIEPAPLDLPQAQGRLRNAAYAFQWWVFGAFAVFLAVRMARDLGLRDDLEAQTPGEDDPGAGERHPDSPDAVDITPEVHSNAT